MFWPPTGEHDEIVIVDGAGGAGQEAKLHEPEIVWMLVTETTLALQVF